MSYRCARLNSTCRGLQPSGLLITRSATSAPTQAMARLPYRPSTLSSAPNTPSVISSTAISTLNTSHTTRPGWLCVSRAKKLDQASEPAYALVRLIFTCDTSTNSTVAPSTQRGSPNT